MTAPQAVLAEAQRLQAAGSYARACALYEELLAREPDSAPLWFNLAASHHLQGDLGSAERGYREALARDPSLLEGYLNLGTVLQAAGRAEEAETLYREGLRHHPAAQQLHNNLGNTLYALGRFDAAIASYDKALQQRGDYAEAWNNRGVALKALGRLEEAAQSFVDALKCKSDYAEAWANLGNTRKAAGDPGGSIECYQHALALRPQDAHTYSNLANALQQLGMLDEALEFYGIALQFAPDLATARWNQGLVELQRGDFERGWADYESGFAAGERPQRAFPAPRWSGQALAGRRLLVYAEQGYGDTLQFARYLPQLRAQGAHVVLECQAPLRRLLDHAGLADELVVRDVDALPEADFQVPLLSLPGLQGTVLATVPASIPYLKVDPAWGTAWTEMLTGLRGLRVGLCWSANPQARNSHERSCPLPALAPLALDGVELVSLQTGAAAGEPAPADLPLWRLDPALGDFAETAAVVDALDLVITVDTAVAHLAGALGRPTWVLLPHVADWRWLVGRSDSPWYPALRLFRQPARGDWPALIDGVARALGEHMRHKTETT